MCLILFAWKTHPKHDLILAANRDEFYDRPTLRAYYWQENSGLLAGKDLTGGGTWIGVAKSGRFAALTNYRDPDHIDPDAPTRGTLTTDFLSSEIPPDAYLEKLIMSDKKYNGFNLLVGNNDSLWYYNNVDHNIEDLPPGLYGLSNGLLNESWPKVESGKAALAKTLATDPIVPEALLKILDSKKIAIDSQLPKTGVPIQWERSLSPLFIATENYGTRCSTIIMKKNETGLFIEKTHRLENQTEGVVRFDF